MKCRECLEHLYEFPRIARSRRSSSSEVRDHLEGCEPCAGTAEFETLYLKFVQARCRGQGAPPD